MPNNAATSAAVSRRRCDCDDVDVTGTDTASPQRPIRTTAAGKTPPNPAEPSREMRWYQRGESTAPPGPVERRRGLIAHWRLHGYPDRAAFRERERGGDRLLANLTAARDGVSPENAGRLAQQLWWYWSGWDAKDAARIVTQGHDCWASAFDPRIATAHPESTLRKRFEKLRAETITLMDEAIGAGLAARVDSYLEHGLIPGGSPEIAVYAVVRFYREAVAILPDRTVPPYEPPQSVRICRGCTAVFEPHRPNHRRCRQCQHKPAAPAFRGPGAAFRVPRLVPGTRVVAGWETARIKECATCGDQFLARDDKEHHCEECRR